DSSLGVFGPNVAMLDFDGSSLALANAVAPIVQIGGAGSTVPAGVEVALAMSGSTAQDALQPYPGDLDFTERVNIQASDLFTALGILGTIVRARATQSTPVNGMTSDLVEVKFGVYPFDFQRTGSAKIYDKNDPIAWSLAEVAAGQIVG